MFKTRHTLLRPREGGAGFRGGQAVPACGLLRWRGWALPPGKTPPANAIGGSPSCSSLTFPSGVPCPREPSMFHSEAVLYMTAPPAFDSEGTTRPGQPVLGLSFLCFPGGTLSGEAPTTASVPRQSGLELCLSPLGSMAMEEKSLLCGLALGKLSSSLQPWG